MKKQVLSILVDNTSGVLHRIAGLFSRRGYNIDSLTVGVTADPRFSRMTIVTSGDDQTLLQIEKQLEKQEFVRSIKILDPADSVSRELIMVKVVVPPEKRQSIMSVVDIFRAKVIDISADSMIIELTGSNSKVSAFIELMREQEILELARTGAAALSRGEDDVVYLD